MRVFKKHVSAAEMTAAVVFWGFLLLIIITQVFFDGNTLALMAVFAVIAVMFSLMVFLPEFYEFREKSFCVSNPKLKREVNIPYENIIKYEAVGLFRQLKRDFDSTEIILSYMPAGGGKKRTISCHPKNVLGFVKTLQERCPNLAQDESEPFVAGVLPEGPATKPDEKRPWWRRLRKGNGDN